ncbi:hypothetical protein [Salinirubrum litoreum]|uniref:Multidrug transporter n=1 Tax=Salinirubrum litoreum TaxID=1126234 RepID=A0ABD5RDM4_9EURY|nr:hypothetical protein [Salinirubrum litoreum]
MPGAGRSDSPTLQLVGAVVFVVALVGAALYGWSFGGSSGDLPTMIGVGVAAVAVGVTIYKRL